MKYFAQVVEPMHEKYVEPLKSRADLVINNKYSQELETVNKLEMIKKTYIFEKNYYFNNLTLIFLKHK